MPQAASGAPAAAGSSLPVEKRNREDEVSAERVGVGIQTLASPVREPSAPQNPRNLLLLLSSALHGPTTEFGFLFGPKLCSWTPRREIFLATEVLAGMMPRGGWQRMQL